MTDLITLAPLQHALHHTPSLKVNELWKPREPNQTWRQWKTTHAELGASPDVDISACQKEAVRRKIPIKDGPDILRWGHSASGNFSVKEAYHLQANHHIQVKDIIWEKVWDKALWPKISTFLWLVIHNRILTWDNLRKRGFVGPSICVLCHSQEETKEHLFNGCSYSQRIWDQGAQIMRRSGQNRSSIRETIGHWGDIIFSNPILNHIWTLLPGFILWQIWKARNKSIFHSSNSSSDLTWNNVVAHIKETIRSRSWKGSDKNCHNDELSILQNWQINLDDLSTAQTPRTHTPSPSSWTPPPTGFVKVNFDGASKGNLGPAGYGAAVRDPSGLILLMTAGYLGETTNNVVELTGILQGLQLAISLPSHQIILEGDSQVIIQLISKILHGATPQKISPSWRLASLLENFAKLCNRSLSITPSHVKRKANAVADYLANEGAQRELESIVWDK
jgi:ribonuclease HI